MPSTVVGRFEGVRRAASDRHSYRLVTLDNGLRALLVSTQQGEKQGGQALTRVSSLRHHDVGGEHSEEEAEAEEDRGRLEEEGCYEDEWESEDGEYEGVVDEEEWDQVLDTLSVDSGGEEVAGEGEEEEEVDVEAWDCSNMAAVALCVGVGSMCDPPEVQGLAHFLEHMLFMGSKAYPDENDFDAFLTRHGGSDNASTDHEVTVYKMDVPATQLSGALDRFAAFFKAPLLKPECMAREVEAVDSEFELARQRDWSRQDQLLAACAVKSHPLGQFGWGNRQSLLHGPVSRGVDVGGQLQAFYRKYYSPHLCSLAAMAPLPLDELETLVDEHFGDMKGDRVDRPFFGSPDNTQHAGFDPQLFPRLVFIAPTKDTHQLLLLWPLPCIAHLYRSKPDGYISDLVGHEGKGSILALLKKRGWALGLGCSVPQGGVSRNSAGSLFIINILLTEEGISHVDMVAGTVFQYLRMLQACPPQKWIHEEQRLVAQLAFDYQDSCEPLDHVEDAAYCMSMFPPEDILTGRYLVDDYDPQAITAVLSHLTPDRVRLHVLSRRHEGLCTQTEPWFGTKYSDGPIRPEWLHQWASGPLSMELSLPPPNPFLPSDFTIKHPQTGTASPPRLVYESDMGRLWHVADTRFGLPRASAFFHLVSPHTNSSPLAAVAGATYLMALAYQLRETTYAAEVADLSYSLTPYMSGVVLKVTGFDHKLPILFNVVVEAMVAGTCTEAHYQLAKKAMVHQLQDKLTKPSMVARDIRLGILQQYRWTAAQKMEALQGLTRADVEAFIPAFYSALHVQAMAIGNITEAEAIDMMQLLESKLPGKPLPKYLFPLERIGCLGKGSHVYHMRNPRQSDDINLVVNYYQIGPSDLRGRVLTELVEVLASEPCFNWLRTKRQLGYDVGATYRNTNGCLGLSVHVQSQSAKYPVSVVDAFIESFLQFLKGELEAMDDETFAEHVQGLVENKLQPDSSMADQAERHWAEIIDMSYGFDRSQHEAAVLPTITRKEVCEFYRTHMAPASQRKLSIQIAGHSEYEHPQRRQNPPQRRTTEPRLLGAQPISRSLTEGHHPISTHSIDATHNGRHLLGLSRLEMPASGGCGSLEFKRKGSTGALLSVRRQASLGHPPPPLRATHSTLSLRRHLSAAEVQVPSKGQLSNSVGFHRPPSFHGRVTEMLPHCTLATSPLPPAFSTSSLHTPCNPGNGTQALAFDEAQQNSTQPLEPLLQLPTHSVMIDAVESFKRTMAFYSELV